MTISGDGLEGSDISLDRDGSLIKKQVKEGTGWQQPKDTARVQLLVSAATDGAVALPGFEPATLLFSVGDGEVADVFEYIVATMRMGERAIVECTDAASCKEAKLGLEDVSAHRIVLTVELISFEHSKDMLELSESERLDFAAGRKAAGARFFRSGSFWLALLRYQKVVELFSYTDNLSSDSRDKALELRRLCESNCAACCLKLQKFDLAVTFCEKVLHKDRDDTKALFRRAQAYLGLAKPGAAVADLRRVVLIDQQNREARFLLKEATQRMKVEEDSKVVPLYSQMCDGLGKGPIPETWWRKYRDFGDGFTHPREEEAWVEEFEKNLKESVTTEARYKVLKEAEEKIFGVRRRPHEENRDMEMRLNAAIEAHSDDFQEFKESEKTQEQGVLPASQEDDETFKENKAAWPDDDSDTEQ